MIITDIEHLKTLAEVEYNRERTDPRPGDRFYLHLSDIRLALQPYASNQHIKILDYGCGGSPYRPLFSDAVYQRADFPIVSGTDFQIGPDGLVNAPSGDFDLLLSTQVLEHCPDPAVYLKEAWRLLRPGGKLILTTHGVFEDHGCPYDFTRWTSYGLDRLVADAGFEVRKLQKLTTARRAVAFIVERHGGWTSQSRWSLTGIFVRGINRVIAFCRLGWHRWYDWVYADNRVVDPGLEGHPIYIALLVEAVKKN